MNPLAQRKQALLLRSTRLRASMQRDMLALGSELEPVVAWAERGLALARWIRGHAAWVSAAAALLGVLGLRARPVHRAATLLRWWQRAKGIGLLAALAWRLFGARRGADAATRRGTRREPSDR